MNQLSPQPDRSTHRADARPVDPALSVVIPVHNEAGNIAPLVDEIVRSLQGRLRYEIVYVDDGSTDATPDELIEARRRCARLRIIRHRQSCGQSTAVRTGVRMARAAWVVTLDGDGQNDPADIPAMLAARDAAGRPDVIVAGVRGARNDRLGKRVGSRLANRLRRWLLKDGARDTGCGIKLFPRDAFLDLPYFDHMHRFLPALFLRAGVESIEHLVNHRPRTSGRSHYGLLDRARVGIVDLLGVAWLQRRAALPVIDLPVTQPAMRSAARTAGEHAAPDEQPATAERQATRGELEVEDFVAASTGGKRTSAP